MMPPDIHESTIEEREAYIVKTFPCISDCDNCGICAIYRGKDIMDVFHDYIEGTTTFLEIQQKYR